MNKLMIAVALAAALGMAAPAMAQGAPAMDTALSATPATAAQGAELNVVARAQAKLKDAGLYSGSVNGNRTLATARAIRQFQRQHNLEITGTLTPETRAALEI